MAMLIFVVVGTGAAYVMNKFKNTEKLVRKDTRVQSYKNLVNDLRSTLYTGNNCTELLTQFNPSVNMNNAKFVIRTYDLDGLILEREEGGVPIRINTGHGNFPGPLEPGWPRKYLGADADRKDIGLETRIKEIRIKWRDPVDLVRDNVQLDLPAAPRPPKLKAVHATIQVIPAHGGINPLLPRNKSLKIKILAYFNSATGALHSCYEPFGDAYYCTYLQKGAFNNSPGIPDNFRCEPDVNCYTKSFPPTGLTSNPGNCPSTSPSRYVPQSVGFRPSGGSRVTPLYECNWCNRHN